MIIAVNTASFLGSKMVKEACGQASHDLRIGADILTRAALKVDTDHADISSKPPRKVASASIASGSSSIGACPRFGIVTKWLPR